jgi:protocatechuate 3,4-dioxygenase beta subunit
VAGAVSKAVGDPILFGGRVVDSGGKPLPGVRVDIWHVNAYGRYHHPDPQEGLPLDPGFRGYGDAFTDVDGWYWFRTVDPAPYTRTVRVRGTFPPHIHMKIWAGSRLLLTTEAQFLPRPDRPAPKGAVNRSGPLAVRWASPEEGGALTRDLPLPKTDVVAVFDVVI